METIQVEDKFKIIKEIGKGGMAAVYLAEDTILKRKVVIKSILKGKLNEQSERRFLGELRTMAKLEHDNIARIYEADKYHNAIMEYIDGNNLETVIEKTELETSQILDYAIQICNGMLEAHSEGVIHRDLKPANIMINRDGKVKILDFGIFKSIDIESNETEEGTVLGTAAYMSPEQIRKRDLDLRTDIFSFGIILYEMITDRHPFGRGDAVSTLHNILNREVDLTGIPPGLDEIVKKTLAKDRMERYANFGAIKKDLELLQERLFKHEAPRLVTSSLPAPKSKRLRTVAIIAVLMIIIIAGFFYLFNSREPSNSKSMVSDREQVYILLDRFEYSEENELSYQIDYLIDEALKQFPQIRAISRDTSVRLSGKESRVEIVDGLKGKNINIRYILGGKISRAGDNYSIEAEIIKTKQQQPGPFKLITTSGESKDSFLLHQVDALAEMVYLALFDQNPEYWKKISDMYGEKWSHFTNFFKALKHYEKEEWEKSADYFSRANEVILSKYYLARNYNRLGDRVKALQFLEELRQQEDRLSPYWNLQVALLKSTVDNNINERLNYLNQLKDAYGYMEQIHYELGEAYFHQCEVREAIQHYKRAIQLNENYSEAFNHLGHCYSYLGEHNKAIDSFETYRQTDQTANSFDSLGDGHFYAGNLILAEAMKKRALTEDRNSIPWAYLTLSDIYLLKAEFKKARKALDDYIDILPKIYSESIRIMLTGLAMTRKAHIYYVEGRYIEGLEILQKSLKIHDSDSLSENTAEAHWLKGLLLLKVGDLKGSKKELIWLLMFTDKNQLGVGNSTMPYKFVVHLRALIREKEGKLTEAERFFRELIYLKEKLSYWATYYNYQYFHTEYAWFLNRQERYREARIEIERCLEFSGDYIPALWCKAEIMERLGDPDESRLIYRRIAELYGKSKERNFYRDKLNVKLKNPGNSHDSNPWRIGR